MFTVRRVIIAGVVLASLAIVASAHADDGGTSLGVRLGTRQILVEPRFVLIDVAPSFTFPGAIRGDSIDVSQLTAAKAGKDFSLTLTVPAPSDLSRDLATRIAFFPAGGKPWALEWSAGDTSAAIVTQEQKGAAGTGTDALPTWSPTGPKPLALGVTEDAVTATFTARILREAGVVLPDLTGVQIQNEESRPDGSVVFQGSPVVDWGALLGHHRQLTLPPVGITYDAQHHSQPWNVVEVCPQCTRPPVVTVTDADLEQRVAEFEATTATKGNKRISVTLSGWVVKSGGYDFDQVRAYGSPYDEASDPSTPSDVYEGVICEWATMRCDQFSGNDHDAELTGEATLETKPAGRRIHLTIVGADFLAPPAFVQYDFLVTPTPGATTTVGVRTPWVKEAPPPAPPGTVTPDDAKDLYLDATTAERLGLTVDESQLTTITDPNQLPTSEETRSNFAANGFLAELLDFYRVPGVDANNPSAAPPGTTVFFSQAVDVLGNSTGRDNIHALFDSQVKNATGLDVVRRGSGAAPTELQATSGGQTTTTAFFDAGDNAIVVVRSVCTQCTPEGARKDFAPVLKAVRTQVRDTVSR